MFHHHHQDIDLCQCDGHTEWMTSHTLLPLSDLSPAGPLVREPITAEAAVDLSRAFKAIADPARLRLLSLIAAHQGGEACVCDLTEPLGLTQPTVSHHLKVLVDAGLLTRDKRGVWAFFAVVPAALDRLSGVLSSDTAAGPFSVPDEQDRTRIPC